MTGGINGDNSSINTKNYYFTDETNINFVHEDSSAESIFENLFGADEDYNLGDLSDDYSEYLNLINDDYSQVSDLSALDEDFTALLDEMGFSAVVDAEGNENQGLYSMTDENGITQFLRAVQNEDGETKIIYNDGSGDGATAFDFQDVTAAEGTVSDGTVESAETKEAQEILNKDYEVWSSKKNVSQDENQEELNNKIYTAFRDNLQSDVTTNASETLARSTVLNKFEFVETQDGTSGAYKKVDAETGETTWLRPTELEDGNFGIVQTVLDKDGNQLSTGLVDENFYKGI
ncbi:MAG: hypothetical protein LUG16_08075 [Candidatus Gastranaerophilales bacterium]|nr:hypothetical protein [Candidatus Gastranaerophilales bacterium]